MSINNDLLYASSTDTPDILKELVERGAALGYADPECGNTALYNAVISGREANVECLLSLGADPNQKIDYRSPVTGKLQKGILASFVAKSGDVVKSLVHAGLDVNAKSTDGLTALHHACVLGADGNSVVMALVAAGADVTIKTSDGKSSLDIVHDQIKRIEDWRVPENSEMIDQKLAYLKARLDILASTGSRTKQKCQDS